MITCAKRGPRRRQERVWQGIRSWRIHQLLLRWTEVLSGKIPRGKRCLGNRAYPPAPHLFYHYPQCVHNVILVNVKAAAELVPKWRGLLPFLRKRGTCFSVVTKIRENAPDKANHDLRLASREPRKSFGPERVFWMSYHAAVLKH